MKERGKITGISGKQAEIEVNPEEKCSKCCSCGASKPRKVTIDSSKIEGFSVGDNVEVEVNPSSMVKIYAVLYLIPLIIFIGVLVGIQSIFNDPRVSFICAFAATLTAYFVIGLGFGKRRDLCPEITRVKETR